jgi:hypothetical protein
MALHTVIKTMATPFGHIAYSRFAIVIKISRGTRSYGTLNISEANACDSRICHLTVPFQIAPSTSILVPADDSSFGLAEIEVFEDHPSSHVYISWQERVDFAYYRLGRRAEPQRTIARCSLDSKLAVLTSEPAVFLDFTTCVGPKELGSSHTC